MRRTVIALALMAASSGVAPAAEVTLDVAVKVVQLPAQVTGITVGCYTCVNDCGLGTFENRRGYGSTFQSIPASTHGFTGTVQVKVQPPADKSPPTDYQCVFSLHTGGKTDGGVLARPDLPWSMPKPNTTFVKEIKGKLQ